MIASNKDGVKYYTTDGKEVESGSYYFNGYGEQVMLDEVVENQEGVVKYLVTPIYEGEALDSYLDPGGGGYSEGAVPYEHHGEQRLVNAIFAKEPNPKFGGEYKAAIADLEKMAIFIGGLKKEGDELAKKSLALLKTNDDLAKQAAALEERVAARSNELDELREKCDSKRQQLSEMEDSIGSFDGNEDIVTIKASELKRLRKDEFELVCLRAGGVANWDWYSDSLEDYRKRYPEG